MNTTKRLAVALLVGCVLASPAFSFTTTAQPDAAYLGSTTLIPIGAAELSNLVSITDGTATVNFDTALQVRTVPGNWFTWNSPPNAETPTPRVLWTQTQSQVFLSFPTALSTFGFEAEPEAFGLADIRADYYNGFNLIGSIIRSVDGNGGSLLFAGQDPGAFTGVAISSSGPFAIAQLRYDIAAAPPVPEPASVVLVTGSLLGLLARRRRS